MYYMVILMHNLHNKKHDLNLLVVFEFLMEERSVTRAAEAIGWTRQKLYRRMRALSIERQSELRVPESGVITSSDSSTFQ